ncbi:MULTISPECIES: hypothetical protein [unclassified Nonomuraea]
MTLPPDEHGEILRRVLRAEADAVVPSPEGLEIIRARIERRGLRGLFWWRAGAAAAGAVLVAGTIVMVVPDLRNMVIVPAVPVDNGTELPPDNSSTTRPPAKLPPTRRTQPAVPPPPVTHSPATETSETHAPVKKTPTPTPTPTPCAKESAQPRAEECLDATPTPTPSATPSETTQNPDNPDCSAEQCSPEDPAPSPSEIATPLSSP